MNKILVLFALSILLISCGRSIKSPKEFYETGAVQSKDLINDFTRIDNDNDSLVDIYKYNHDSAFVVELHYNFERNKILGYAFYYNNMKVGKWIIHDYTGKLYSEHNYQNDRDHGFALIYGSDSTILRFKEFYDNGKLLYTIKYDDNGVMIDSTGGQ